jgi:uncharacterized cupredoxin-like copper-binding protein
LLTLLVLATTLIASLAIACGDGGTEVEPEPDPEPESEAPAGVVLTPPPGATEVNVTLSEFILAPDVESVPAGEVYFLATNAGGEAHEMVVVKSDLAPDALPNDDGRVPEDEVDMIGEIEPFAPGSDASVAFDLEPGKYVLLCNIVEEEASGKTESHYLEGMYTGFTVE